MAAGWLPFVFVVKRGQFNRFSWLTWGSRAFLGDGGDRRDYMIDTDGLLSGRWVVGLFLNFEEME